MNPRNDLNWAVVAVAGGMLAVALFFGGGSDYGNFLPAALTAVFVAGAVVVATLAGLLPRPQLDGPALAFVGLLAGFVLWSGLSVWWSIAPDLTWNLFNRELAYVAFAVTGIYVGALVPNALRVVATGLAVALGAVITWALIGKVFPSLVESGGQIARLRAPVGYWNALALLCAAAAVLGLWVASDRERGHGARAAGAVLVYGAVVAVVLTYSRSGVVLTLAGALAWVLAGRRPFESLATFALAALASVPVLVYAFLSPGVADDNQPYAVRAHDGAIFAPVVLACACVVAGVAYWLVGRPGPSPQTRRTVVRATLGGLAAAAVVALVVVVVRAGGPGPWIEARWHAFASSTSVPNSQPTRFGTLSSNHRWEWWKEAWRSFEAAPGDGRGAGTFPVVNLLERRTPITVTQPHNLFLQALSDVGVVGFLLLVGAAVAAVLAGIRTVRRTRGPDRGAALALGIVGAAYLVQSLVDVDWDFVAVSGPGLFVAGALAARGASAPARAPAWALGVAGAACVAAVSLLLPWMSAQKTEDAYAAMERGAYNTAAGDASSARSLNSLAVDPLYALGEAETLRGRTLAAERAYAHAVRLQPDNPDTWFNLGTFELAGGAKNAACVFLTHATRLDPFDTEAASAQKQACA